MRAALLLAVAAAIAAAGLVDEASAPSASTPRARRAHVLDAAANRAPLPRVLLIGDSIAMGYTPAVRARLQGAAAVVRIPENGGATTDGRRRLRRWLGTGPWDVIHFNFGLHDLEVLASGGHLVPPAEYRRNLVVLVRRLRATGARLVWATTTPVPHVRLRPRRYAADVLVYNAIARRVMRANGVAVDDLYRFALPREARIQKPRNVHFTASGYAALGRQVAAAIRAVLETSRQLQP